PRIGETPRCDLADQYAVEIRTDAGTAEEVATAQDDDAQALVGRVTHARLDGGPDLALARGRAHRGRLIDDGRNAGAIDVEIARKHQRRAVFPRRGDGRLGQWQRGHRPLRIR